MIFNQRQVCACCFLLACVLTTVTLAENPTDNKLFSEVGENLGVQFVSRLIPDHKLAFLYHSGMTCSGLAAGDLNGDKRPDLLLANGPGNNAVYVQSKDGSRFQDVTNLLPPEFQGIEDWASGVAMSDVDNDGDLDVYICNYESANLLFINESSNGKLKFRECAAAANVAIVDASHFANFCDYDNDGDMDFFLLTNRVEDPNGMISDLPVEFERPGIAKLLPDAERYYDLWVYDFDNWGVAPTGRPDYLFRNDGVDENGQVKFSDVTQESGVLGRGDGLSCTWWDYDLDGDSDLYVCNDFISTDRFYVNNGDGTFTNRIGESVPHTTWFSMGSSFGDIDNDLDFDFVVADMAATNHYKSKVTMGIMGGMDLKRANESFPPQYMRNSVLINETNGLFREAAYLAGLSSSDWTWAVKLEDFDADGKLDVYLSNGVPREMNHSDIKITKDMLTGKHMWEYFKEGEMRKEQNRAFRNRGELKFEDVSKDWGLDHLGATYGAVATDLDLDGDLDLVTMNLEENVKIYRNAGNGNSQFTLELVGTRSNKFGVGAIVEVTAGDDRWVKQLSPGKGYHSYDEPILHFGIKDHTKIDRIDIRWPSGISQSVTNPKLEARIKITESENSGQAVASRTEQIPLFKDSMALEDLWHHENSFDDFALQSLLPHKLSAEGPCMAWGDVNGDSHVDVFVGGAAGSPGEVRLNDGKGNFAMAYAPLFIADAAAEDSAVAFLDFDGDDDLDLLVGRGSYEFESGDPLQKNRLYINDGRGKFSASSGGIVPDSAFNSGTIAVDDFDQDGDPDVFVGTRVKHADFPLSQTSEIWSNDKQRFSILDDTKQDMENLGLVTDAVWADIDGDGWNDLIVAREWDSIAIFKNDKGKLKRLDREDDLSKRTGWWSAIAAADVDSDGDIDLVAGNIGLNTKYKTSLEKPMTVYYGQFDDSGQSHIVEVKQEGNVCYPERGRSCSSHAMPFIAEKFDSYHEFGLATLNDIYGDDKLAAAKKFEANTFEHGVFVNDGTGNFKFAALPRIAQIAPSQSLAVLDFDGDGLMDILLGQNFFGPQQETGRYDGGLGQLLRNKGDLIFEPVKPGQSGILVRDPTTAIGVIDVNGDGKNDVALATNDGPVRVFVRQERE